MVYKMFVCIPIASITHRIRMLSMMLLCYMLLYTPMGNLLPCIYHSCCLLIHPENPRRRDHPGTPKPRSKALKRGWNTGGQNSRHNLSVVAGHGSQGVERVFVVVL